jgi:hypothetical protein
MGYINSLAILAIMLVGSKCLGSEPVTSQPCLTGSIKVYSAGWAPLVLDYFRAILKESNRHSSKKYGPCELQFVNNEMTKSRIHNEMEGGLSLHVEVTSARYSEQDIVNYGDQFEFPFLKGLLGLRSLIVQKDASASFAEISSIGEFRKKIPGQVYFWPDVALYRDSGIEVKGAVSINNLIPMLVNRRFDYLPLSIIEAGDILSKSDKHKEHLVLQDDLYIYYQAPVFIAFSRAHPQLRTRLLYGINEAFENGDIDRLFQHYFERYIAMINADTSSVFMLENSQISGEANAAEFRALINNHFSEKTKVFKVKRKQ